MSVPNQRYAVIDKEPCDKKHLYTTNNIEALQQAMCDLNGNEFKLWMFFAKNKNGFQLEIYPTEITSSWGIKRATYYNAFEKLVKYGYLEEIDKNHYIFHEKPVMVEPLTIDIDKDEYEF